MVKTAAHALRVMQTSNWKKFFNSSEPEVLENFFDCLILGSLLDSRLELFLEKDALQKFLELFAY